MINDELATTCIGSKTCKHGLQHIINIMYQIRRWIIKLQESNKRSGKNRGSAIGNPRPPLMYNWLQISR